MKAMPNRDERFITLVRIALTNEAIEKGRMITLDFCECAAGVVATATRFFYDPMRWKLRKKEKIHAPAGIVEVQCKGLNDVSDVVAFARKKLTALKGDVWRDDIFE